MPSLSEVRGKDLIVASLRDKYLSNSEIDPDQCKQSMGAGDAVAKCLFKWLVAVEAYDKVAKQVAPKKEALQKLDSELETSTKEVDEVLLLDSFDCSQENLAAGVDVF